jgi:hypothetical protein
MDNNLKEQVLPAVVQADKVEVMSSLLSGGIQYLSSNYPAHTQHTGQHPRKLHHAESPQGRLEWRSNSEHLEGEVIIRKRSTSI